MVFVSLSAGCQSGLSRIDQRTQDLLKERSETLGTGALAPAARTAGPPEAFPDRIHSRDLSTNNPPASELRYRAADEGRDMAARLEGYLAEGVDEASAISLNLQEAFRTAQRSAREFLSAEEEYIFAAVRLLIERHQWTPRLTNETSLRLSGTGDDGSFQSAVRVLNELRVSQRLPYGGTANARWVWDATEQLRRQATGRYRQSSELALDATIPLLRGAGLVAQESLIQAERDLIYRARDFEDFRRRFLTEIARDYFALLQSQAQIRNQLQQLESLQQTERAQERLFQAGRIAEFRHNIARNDVLEAKARLANLRERYALQVDQFKIRLGIPTAQTVVILPEVLEFPEPDTTLSEATTAALEYRLDLQTRRDQLDDARRGVRNAANAILPSLNWSGSVGVPTDPDDRVGGFSFSPEDLNYSTSITFGLPLDREIERLQLRQSIITLQARERDYNRFRDQVVVNVRQSVRNIELSRFQLTLAEQRVEINRRRVQEVELKRDQVDTQTELDAKNALLQAENARDQALTDLRNAVLNYLLESGQLRVERDGTFLRLPGMDPEAPEGP